MIIRMSCMSAGTDDNDIVMTLAIMNVAARPHTGNKDNTLMFVHLCYCLQDVMKQLFADCPAIINFAMLRLCGLAHKHLIRSAPAIIPIFMCNNL